MRAITVRPLDSAHIRDVSGFRTPTEGEPSLQFSSGNYRKREADSGWRPLCKASTLVCIPRMKDAGVTRRAGALPACRRAASECRPCRCRGSQNHTPPAPWCPWSPRRIPARRAPAGSHHPAHVRPLCPSRCTRWARRSTSGRRRPAGLWPAGRWRGPC